MPTVDGLHGKATSIAMRNERHRVHVCIRGANNAYKSSVNVAPKGIDQTFHRSGEDIKVFFFLFLILFKFCFSCRSSRHLFALRGNGIGDTR